MRKNLLCPRFVEADGERERIRTGVGYLQHFEHRRYLRLAGNSVESLGNIKNDLGALAAQFFEGILVRLDERHIMDFRQAMPITAPARNPKNSPTSAKPGLRKPR